MPSNGLEGCFGSSNTHYLFTCFGTEMAIVFLSPIPSEEEHQQTFLAVYWIGTMPFQIRFFIKIGPVESNFSEKSI